jgi:hypothetical protein
MTMEALRRKVEGGIDSGRDLDGDAAFPELRIRVRERRRKKARACGSGRWTR